MDLSSKRILLTLFIEIAEWRRRKEIVPSNMAKFRWSDIQLSIVRDYFINHSKACDFRKLPLAKFFDRIFQYTGPGSSRIRAKIAACFAQELKEFFMVPRLNKFLERENRIRKYQVLEAFISFLLHLLYDKTDSIIDPCKDRIGYLEKELRVLLTILGDTSLMLCGDQHEEFQDLMAEFEAVANEAGSLVHSLLFTTRRAFRKMNEGLVVVLSHIDLLKVNVMKFLNLPFFCSRSTYITPETSAVDSLLIVNSVINDLEDLMNQEDSMIADAKDQLKILHKGLKFLQSSIKDVGSPQPSEIGELKEPLVRIGDVAHEAEYLIISILVGDAPSWYLINRLPHVNHKIQLIGAEVEEITKKYKFEGLKVGERFRAQISLQAKRNSEVNDVTVGFEENATDILDKLVGGTKHMQVITIFGMPGLGKTTLAKKLYNHPLVNSWFDKQSWCVVSQTYQRQNILAEVLIHIKSELGKDRILKMEEESLVEYIYKTLKGRRYLVVMDDIWDMNTWDDLWRCFPDDGNGSRVLFTTRNKDVAPPNSLIYALPPLSNEQSWELLEKKVFDNKPCSHELVETGKKIAANCSGLPLTVVVIAGILSTLAKEKSTWEEVGGNLASYIFDGGDNSVMQILELSYKHLPEYLKPCFLYFGAFREDKEIRVEELARLWISEGFIHMEEEKSAENAAEEYLMELIDKSLVMIAKRRSDGGIKTCVIHDLLRELCLKRSEEENFMKSVKNNDYSIYKKGHRVKALEVLVDWSCCQHVRSIHAASLMSLFYIRDMRLLRVLHFEYIFTHHRNFDHHLIGIEYLINLRYLVIPDLPASIGCLVNLEYVRVKSSLETIWLPQAIVSLRKLRYIEVTSAGSTHAALYGEDCNSSHTNNLEFLSCISIMEVRDEEMLRCPPHLRKLKLLTRRHVDLSFLTQLETLNVKSIRYGALNVCFPSSIKKLTLSEMKLPVVVMSMIGRLENLEVLKLRSISFDDERWDTRNGEFEQLTFLNLDTRHLCQWNVASSQHFPKLERLVLSNCRCLEEIPSEIGEIATLQMVEVKGLCLGSLVESATRIQQEQWDVGNEVLRVIMNDCAIGIAWWR